MNEIYDGSVEPTVLRQRKKNPEAAAKLVAQGVNPLLASLYASRDVTDISEVRGTIKDIIPTSELKNCREMASVLADHIVMRKRVVIVGDFDSDGANAAALMYAGCCASGMNVDVVVPDRKKHGYGLSEGVVRELALLDPKPEVVVTVDCGISSNEGVALANSLGMEVLITDHHPAPTVLPDAKLIVNPHQPGCNFESKTIAGCGVAWYAMKALSEEMADRDYPAGFDPMHLLQFVAIGTVADVVGLDKNNRILVREGLHRIRIGECTEGIRALMAIIEKPLRFITTEDIGFQIAPRINASGRMAHMQDGIDCLLEMSPVRALEIAKRLDAVNKERKEVEREISAAAEAEIDRFIEAQEMNLRPDTLCVIAHDDKWHEGVVGIVAGRLKEKHHRPAFVFCRSEGGALKGSGRSIPGFHLRHALEEIANRHPEIIKHFGGHPMACGLTLNDGMLSDFKMAMAEICREHLDPSLLQRVVEHDGPFDWSNFNVGVVQQLASDVWGQGFPPPVFMDTLELADVHVMGSEKNHLKANIVRDDEEYEVVAFGEGERAATLPSELTVLHRPNINWYNYEEKLQLMVANIPSEPVVAAYVAEQKGLEAVQVARCVIDEELRAAARMAPRVYRP